MSLAQKRLSNAYKGSGGYRDKFTVAQLSSAAMSTLPKPTSKFRVEKQTFEIGGTEYEIVTDISTISS